MKSNLTKINNNKSGIYLISSTIDNRVYIGSAVIFRKRRDLHELKLKQNKHHSAHLQNFVNKYGIECLYFEVLEECGKEHLIEREQYHMDKLKPSFNMCKTAGSAIGVKRSDEFKRNMSIRNKGKKLSEETKLKKSIAMKKYHSENPSFREKSKIASEGRTFKHSEESKDKMRLNNKKRLSEDTILQIYNLVGENIAQKDISEKLGISTYSIRKYIKLKNEL